MNGKHTRQQNKADQGQQKNTQTKREDVKYNAAITRSNSQLVFQGHGGVYTFPERGTAVIQ